RAEQKEAERCEARLFLLACGQMMPMRRCGCIRFIHQKGIAMATVAAGTSGPITLLGGLVYDAVSALGDLSLFAGQTFGWLARRRPSPGTLVGSFYSVGVRSVPVVAVTGTLRTPTE